MSVEFLNPAGLPRGAYSHVAVVRGGRTIHVSGQVAFDEAGRVVGTTFDEQVERVFANLATALAAAGAELRHVVKMTTFVVGLTPERAVAVRTIRARHFGGHLPASTMVATPALIHPELLIEVEAVAVVEA